MCAQDQLKKFDKRLAARMEKAIGSGSSKALRQDVLHQQVEEIFSRNRSGPIRVTFCVDITERDFAVLTAYDVLFLDDPFVQILAEVNDRFVAVAHFFAVDNPFFWCAGRYS